LLKVIATGEALRVDFVDLFGAGGPGREPAALGDHLDAADRGTIARRLVEDAFDLFAGEFAGAELFRSAI
jgi:hypothetical protein